MRRTMAIGWKLQNQGQEIPESASSGHKPVERRLRGAAPFGSKGAEVAFASSCQTHICNVGAQIMLPAHFRGVLPTVAAL